MVDTVYMAESITKTVLPGNPVTREYEVRTLYIFAYSIFSTKLSNEFVNKKVVRHIGSAGPGMLWKLYAGYKKSTKQVDKLKVKINFKSFKIN